MRTIIITTLALILCTIACSSPSPLSLADVYEGIWTDEQIPLTLTIIHEAGTTFAYDLSTGDQSYLTGTLYGYPDNMARFAYDDGEQRQMAFTGFIDGDLLSGVFTHTGLGYDERPVEMVRG